MVGHHWDLLFPVVHSDTIQLLNDKTGLKIGGKPILLQEGLKMNNYEVGTLFGFQPKLFFSKAIYLNDLEEDVRA